MTARTARLQGLKPILSLLVVSALAGCSVSSTAHLANSVQCALPGRPVVHFTSASGTCTAELADGWRALSDEAALADWKSNESPPTSLHTRNGEIVFKGSTAPLYYRGPVQLRELDNFELELEVLTRKGATAAIHFHTTWTWHGPPERGYAVRVDNTHPDAPQTASLEGIQEHFTPIAPNDTWFTLNIRVQGKRILTRVNGTPIADFTEPDNWKPPVDHPRRRITYGTVALQPLDPSREVRFRNIKVRQLPRGP